VYPQGHPPKPIQVFWEDVAKVEARQIKPKMNTKPNATTRNLTLLALGVEKENKWGTQLLS
jgi:hypothetical protein